MQRIVDEKNVMQRIVDAKQDSALEDEIQSYRSEHPKRNLSPLYVAEFNIKLRIRNNGCNDACRRNRHQIADQCMEEDQ